MCHDDLRIDELEGVADDNVPTSAGGGMAVHRPFPEEIWAGVCGKDRFEEIDAAYESIYSF